jgi:Ca2+-binding RTX toxin-like protein
MQSRATTTSTRSATIPAALGALLLSAALPADATTCKPGGVGPALTCDHECPNPPTICTPDLVSVCTAANQPCVICGDGSSETIIGTPHRDVICATGGDDIIYGLGSDDVIDAGGGNDKVYAGSGDDLVLGEAGTDEIHGGGGSDQLSGGTGNDTLVSNVLEDRDQPADFSTTQGTDGWRYLHLTSELPDEPDVSETDSCSGGGGATYSGAGYHLHNETLAGGWIVLDDTRDILFMRPIDVFGTALPITFEYSTPVSANYRVTGDFARASECQNGGDGVIVQIVKDPAVGSNETLFNKTIGSNHTVDADDPFGGTGNEHFDLKEVMLLEGDKLYFYVYQNGVGFATNDVTALRVTLDSGGDDDFGSRLDGGEGSDVLEASGPGHQCLDGGPDSGDTCSYSFDGNGPSTDRDDGTAADCESTSGVSSSRTPHCSRP